MSVDLTKPTNPETAITADPARARAKRLARPMPATEAPKRWGGLWADFDRAQDRIAGQAKAAIEQGHAELAAARARVFAQTRPVQVAA